MLFDEESFKAYASNITPDRDTGIGKWSDASIAGKAILAATALWMLGIMLVGIYFLLRAIVRVSRKPLD